MRIVMTNVSMCFKQKKILMNQIEAIGNKFLADGSGWFNKVSFVRTNTKPKYKKLLGGANVPECV